MPCFCFCLMFQEELKDYSQNILTLAIQGVPLGRVIISLSIMPNFKLFIVLYSFFVKKFTVAHIVKISAILMTGASPLPVLTVVTLGTGWMFSRTLLFNLHERAMCSQSLVTLILPPTSTTTCLPHCPDGTQYKLEEQHLVFQFDMLHPPGSNVNSTNEISSHLAFPAFTCLILRG